MSEDVFHVHELFHQIVKYCKLGRYQAVPPLKGAFHSDCLEAADKSY